MPTAYKLFKVKKTQPGKLFPLFVLSDVPTPIGEWIEAVDGPRTDTGKVKSTLGELAYRPGWHLTDIPLVNHIGIKEQGVIKYMRADAVWVECEYDDSVNYQEEADKNGYSNGKFNPRNAYLQHVPEDGYYKFKTNPMMFNTWIIAGRIKVNRILSDDEVAEICRKSGYTSQPRKTPLDMEAYGFAV